jgi:hypothetical protein
MPVIFRSGLHWVCQSIDHRGLITGIGWTEAEARANWAELVKRYEKRG